VRFDQAACDCQAQARAARLGRFREAFEEPWQQLGIDPRPLVGAEKAIRSPLRSPAIRMAVPAGA
jgi:hypothetical protein